MEGPHDVDAEHMVSDEASACSRFVDEPAVDAGVVVTLPDPPALLTVRGRVPDLSVHRTPRRQPLAAWPASARAAGASEELTTLGAEPTNSLLHVIRSSAWSTS